MTDEQQIHARHSWSRLRKAAAEELADYLHVEVSDAYDLIERQDYRIRVSVMAWDQDGVPAFDTQCGSLDKRGKLRIPPLNFIEGIGWTASQPESGMDTDDA